MTRTEDLERHLIDDVELACLEAVLALDSAACQEAALHGLGHRVFEEPRCERIIDDYLASGRAARPELVVYARAARGGCIL